MTQIPQKINLKGQRKEWFGLLPVCCFKENTHGLNCVVLVYHRWTQQHPPQESVPSLSTPRHQNNVVLWNRSFDRWYSSAASNSVARTFSVRFRWGKGRRLLWKCVMFWKCGSVETAAWKFPASCPPGSRFKRIEWSSSRVDGREEKKKYFHILPWVSNHEIVWAMPRGLAQPLQPSRNFNDRKPVLPDGTTLKNSPGTNLCCCSMWAMWPRVFCRVNRISTEPVVDPIIGFKALKCWILFSKALLWMQSSEAYQNIDSVERLIWQVNSSTTR